MRYSGLAVAIALVTAPLAGVIGSFRAAEGMWEQKQLPEIAGPLKKAGLKLKAKQLANLTGDPMGAVVSLGGCTASFVSPRGLVVTNHHCAYGAIQLNSTPAPAPTRWRRSRNNWSQVARPSRAFAAACTASPAAIPIGCSATSRSRT